MTDGTDFFDPRVVAARLLGRPSSHVTNVFLVLKVMVTFILHTCGTTRLGMGCRPGYTLDFYKR